MFEHATYCKGSCSNTTYALARRSRSKSQLSWGSRGFVEKLAKTCPHEIRPRKNGEWEKRFYRINIRVPHSIEIKDLLFPRPFKECNENPVLQNGNQK